MNSFINIDMKFETCIWKDMCHEIVILFSSLVMISNAYPPENPGCPERSCHSCPPVRNSNCSTTKITTFIIFLHFFFFRIFMIWVFMVAISLEIKPWNLTRLTNSAKCQKKIMGS